MEIREVLPQDNQQIETLIRSCLIEFNANKPGCAWEDPYLDRFYEVYQKPHSKYWVVIDQDQVVAGCGIGPFLVDGVCELQKMYAYPQYRGTGIAKKLLDLALDFAKEYYEKCYLETFANMTAANKFYIKNGFEPLEKPLVKSEHYACDRWYLFDLSTLKEYTITEVIKKYNITASALRYYEKQKLLPKIKKDSRGQRVYTKQDLNWLELIICMRKTGMKISYIRNYVELCNEGNSTIKERYQIFLDQKNILESQMSMLEENLKVVNHKINIYKREMERQNDPLNPSHEV